MELQIGGKLWAFEVQIFRTPAPKVLRACVVQNSKASSVCTVYIDSQIHSMPRKKSSNFLLMDFLC